MLAGKHPCSATLVPADSHAVRPVSCSTEQHIPLDQELATIGDTGDGVERGGTGMRSNTSPLHTHGLGGCPFYTHVVSGGVVVSPVVQNENWEHDGVLTVSTSFWSESCSSEASSAPPLLPTSSMLQALRGCLGAIAGPGPSRNFEKSEPHNLRTATLRLCGSPFYCMGLTT